MNGLFAIFFRVKMVGIADRLTCRERHVSNPGFHFGVKWSRVALAAVALLCQAIGRV